MALNMKLQLRQSQQLIMTPQLRQAIKLLQLSRLELQQLVDQALIENPVLEEAPPEGGDGETLSLEEYAAAEDGAMIESEQHIENDAEWREYVGTGAGAITERGTRSDGSEPSLEATLAGTETLQDHLYWQLEMSSLTLLEQRIGRLIIGNLDDDGYLAVSLLEILQALLQEDRTIAREISRALREREGTSLPLPQAVDSEALALRREGPLPSFDDERPSPPRRGRKALRKKAAPLAEEPPAAALPPLPAPPKAACQLAQAVLGCIQQFDPLGVGARTLQECLNIQMCMIGLENSLAHRLVKNHLKLLERRDLARAARKTRASEAEVIEAYKIILSLEPKPGRPFGGSRTQTVIPDIYLLRAPGGMNGGEDQVGQYRITLNDTGIPRLKISQYYRRLAESAAQDSSLTQEYIQEKIRAGNWLMKSIEQRQKTILKVAKSIVRQQYDFFERGPAHLKPLVLKDVAEDIEAHESTVSRITTSKYIHTARGVFELKYFFASGIDQGQGEIVSSKKIKDMISKIVAGENPKKPLTDIQIAESLSGTSKIKVARRTVAKYREALHILPSNRRKRPF